MEISEKFKSFTQLVCVCAVTTNLISAKGSAEMGRTMKILKKVSIICLLFLAINAFTACSKKDSSGNSMADTAPTTESGKPEEYYGDMDNINLNQLATNNDGVEGNTDSSTNINTNTVYSSRKLIRRIQISAETLMFDKAMEAITNEVNGLGGYSENSEIYERGSYNSESRYAYLTLRVPSNKVEQLLNLVGKNTNILSKKETTEDVTLNYVDTQARVKSLEIQQERLLKLLEEADSLENIIILEQRLSDVRYELEEYASRLRAYDNLVEYATLTLEISEVNKITPIETKGILNRMGTGISKSLGNVYNGLINFIVWFVVNLPYIIIWSTIIFITVTIGKKIDKKRRKIIFGNMEQIPEESKVKGDENNQ